MGSTNTRLSMLSSRRLSSRFSQSAVFAVRQRGTEEITMAQNTEIFTFAVVEESFHSDMQRNRFLTSPVLQIV